MLYGCRAGERLKRAAFVWTCVGCMLAMLGIASFSPAATQFEDAVTIELEVDGRLSVRGQWHSTVEVVRALCERAGIALDWQSPADAAFAVRIERRSPQEALELILRGRNYWLGFAMDSDTNDVVVRSVRIVGNGSGDAVRTSSRSTPAGPTTPTFVVKAARIRAAFASHDPDERARELRRMATDIGRDAEQRQAFLETDPQLIARTLSALPYAREGLRELMTAQEDPSAREKLSRVLIALDSESSASEPATR